MSELEKRHQYNPQPDRGRTQDASSDEAGQADDKPVPAGATPDLPLSSPD